MNRPLAPNSLLGISLALAGACTPQLTTSDGGSADSGPVACGPVSIEPAAPRVGTNHTIQLRARGGTGHAVFGVMGDAAGATVELGGGVHAGPTPGMFTVVARDSVCGAQTTAVVQIVGPFDVQPAVTRVMPGGTQMFTASGNVGAVEYAVISAPDASGGTIGSIDASGKFTAGTVAGEYSVLARDTGDGDELRLQVTVGAGTPLQPASPQLAVPAGGRVPLDWVNGAATDLVTTVTGPAGGAVMLTAGRMWFDATAARAGYSDIAAMDRSTGDMARVRVFVGDTVGPRPTPRGAQSGLGALASGDVNADGNVDLIVGHAERSKVGVEAGGVLVFHGNAQGAFGDRPDEVIEGVNAYDHVGSVLLVKDVNGDNVADVLVGSPERDVGANDRGEMDLYLGSPTGLIPDPERVLIGEAKDASFGASILVGDTNGDGAEELIVGAPGQADPADPNCKDGRVYVFRHNVRPEITGVFEAVPSQVLNVRDSMTDADANHVGCGDFQYPPNIRGGVSLALLDMDGDGKLDLAVGAPGVGFPDARRYFEFGAVEIFRGADGAVFETTPAWSIHPDESLRAYYADFGESLDVLTDAAGKKVLVVRASRVNSDSGAFWVFPPGSLGAPAPAGSDGMPQIKTLTSASARAFYLGGTQGKRVGRSAAVADFDGDGQEDYAVGAAGTDQPGDILLFGAVAAASGSGMLSFASELPYTSNELQGYRIAALPAMNRAMGTAAGLASWAGYRNTSEGLFVGAVDYTPAGMGALGTRWGTRRAISLPAFGAGDHAGQRVAIGSVNGDVVTFVGAPGAHSAMTAMDAAGLHQRTGAVESYGASGTAASSHLSGDRDNANLGDAPVVLLDFDGDGKLELAVADPTAASGGNVPAGFANPDACVRTDSAGNANDLNNRGMVHIYALTPSGPVERFRALPRTETMTDQPHGNWFGSALAVADVNGDGKQDLVVGRAGGPASNGMEVVLGRANPDASTVLVACNHDDAFNTAFAVDGQRYIYGSALANVGDIDGDGCDDVAAANGRAPGYSYFWSSTSALLLIYGYDPSGAHCAGHTQPFLLHVVRDATRLLDNQRAAGGGAQAVADARLDDERDYGDAEGAGFNGTARVLPLGHGDVTGDGVPDLAFGDYYLEYRTYAGAVVELVSGSFLKNLCPNHACTDGLNGPLWSDGDYHALALSNLDLPDRLIVPAPSPLSLRFGRAISMGDLSGDGTAELVVGAPDDLFGGPFVGGVYVYKGGSAFQTDNPLARQPWLIAVGDVRERSDFGTSVAQTASANGGRWLAVGTPLSNRAGTGAEVGAVYRFPITEAAP